MAKTHNKKRNIGIIYEQIISFVCLNLMKENKEPAEKAISIIKNSFKKGSQLRKEYKLFKALVSTNNVTDHLATSIILKAKEACNEMFDSDKLEIEKSKLIKELNYNLGKGVIFEQKVTNYRAYATIQTLLNEWRSQDSDFGLLTEYEIKLHNSLTNKKIDEPVKLDIPHNVSSLTRSLMSELFSEKYSDSLNETQKDLLNTYISDDDNLLIEKYSYIKAECVKALNEYVSNCNNEIILEKSDAIKDKLAAIDESCLSKSTLQKFLMISKLKEEILGEG
jgi:hypothetical protein